MYLCTLLTVFHCSSSQIFSHKAEHPDILKLIRTPPKIIQYTGHQAQYLYESKESNPELPGIINTEVDRKQSNVDMLAVQLAYDYAIHHGGSYDVQQHVISQKHHRNARESIRAGTDRSLQHKPVVQDTKQMHLWCVIRFSFACTYCRSKHWHKRWKIAGSVLSAGFFDQRLHFFKINFFSMPQCTYWIQESLHTLFVSSHEQCWILICTLIGFPLDIVMDSLTMKIVLSSSKFAKVVSLVSVKLQHEIRNHQYTWVDLSKFKS